MNGGIGGGGGKRSGFLEGMGELVGDGYWGWGVMS
jgi:hypothetical protein